MRIVQELLLLVRAVVTSGFQIPFAAKDIRQVNDAGTLDGGRKAAVVSLPPRLTLVSCPRAFSSNGL